MDIVAPKGLNYRLPVVVRNARALSDASFLTLLDEIRLCRDIIRRLEEREDDQGLSLLALYLTTLTKLLKQEQDMRKARHYTLSVQEALQLAQIISNIIRTYLTDEQAEIALSELRRFLGEEEPPELNDHLNIADSEY
jgi:hypothetical protein